MRRLSAIGCAALVLALTAAVASATPDSGIRGRMIVGPTCPVQRPGATCTRPYQGRLTIRREPSNAVARRLRSAPDGRFSVALRPGRYRLQPRSGRPYPRGEAQTVTVTRGRFTDVTITFDSGIR